MSRSHQSRHLPQHVPIRTPHVCGVKHTVMEGRLVRLLV